MFLSVFTTAVVAPASGPKVVRIRGKEFTRKIEYDSAKYRPDLDYALCHSFEGHEQGKESSVKTCDASVAAGLLAFGGTDNKINVRRLSGRRKVTFQEGAHVCREEGAGRTDDVCILCCGEQEGLVRVCKFSKDGQWLVTGSGSGKNVQVSFPFPFFSHFLFLLLPPHFFCFPFPLSPFHPFSFRCGTLKLAN